MLPSFAAPYLIGLVTAPLVAKVIKPLLRGTVKTTVGVGLRAKKLAAEAAEELQDPAAEVSAEMAAAEIGTRSGVSVSEPRVTEPKVSVTEPKVTEPRVAEPKVSATEPKITEPKVSVDTSRDMTATRTLSTAYFFRGDRYVRFNVPADKVDDGYPLPIAENWKGFSEADFSRDIDAAVNWGNGKVYVFRGDRYIRFDIAADKVDDEYPLPIAENWKGFSEAGFSRDIDAAVNWGNGKVYVFREGRYIRFDIAADKVDDEYPLPIAGNWKGFSEAGFSREIKGSIDWS